MGERVDFPPMGYNANKQCPLYKEHASDCHHIKKCVAMYKKTGHVLMTVHHKWWPKCDYTTPLEKRFRDLPDEKEELCRGKHDPEHEKDPPRKPSREYMQKKVEEYIAKIALSKCINVQPDIES